jgi:hypothetical protein
MWNDRSDPEIRPAALPAWQGGAFSMDYARTQQIHIGLLTHMKILRQ